VQLAEKLGAARITVGGDAGGGKDGDGGGLQMPVQRLGQPQERSLERPGFADGQVARTQAPEACLQRFERLPDRIQCVVHSGNDPAVVTGMAARVKLQGREFEGTVTSVANRPQSNWMSTAKKYVVQVRIDGEPQEVRPGVTAEVEIIVADLKDVIAVPVAAVMEKRGQYFCAVRKGEAIERRAVTLGLGNDKLINITEGLEDGDALILKDNPEMSQDLLDQAREKMRQYNLVEGGDAATGGIGVMTDGRWKAFAEMAIAQGVYSKDLDYTKAYTLDFVRPAGK
jgi:hypothetical protein